MILVQIILKRPRWLQHYLEIVVTSIKLTVYQRNFDGNQVFGLIGTTNLWQRQDCLIGITVISAKQRRQIQHLIVQLTHTTLKNIELLKHFKIKEAGPTCFGLQGNHHQGATASTQLKLYTWINEDTQSSYRMLSVLWLCIMTCEAVYAYIVHSTHALQFIICSHNTENVLYKLYVHSLNQVLNFS